MKEKNFKNIKNDKSVCAVAEGFVHMSNVTYDKLFSEDKNKDLIKSYNSQLCKTALSDESGESGDRLVEDVDIRVDFNDRCAHGHRKCCLRYEVEVKTAGCNAADAALGLAWRAAKICTDFILNYDLEVQVHRIRLLRVDFRDKENWVRPDNFDPKKGPRIHGC